MGAEYSFYMKSIETNARAFLALIILPIGSVYRDVQALGRFTFYHRDIILYVLVCRSLGGTGLISAHNMIISQRLLGSQEKFKEKLPAYFYN